MLTTSRYSVAPRFKGITGFDNAELAVIYDSADLSSDSDKLTGSTFEFFPTRADNDVSRANYIRNPLPKTRSYDVVGIGLGFDFNSLTIVPGDQGDVDVGAFWNAITDGELTFTTSEQDQLIGKHVQELMDMENGGITPYGSDDGGTGDGFTRVLHFPNTRVYRFEDPLHLDSQEVFEVDIELQDTTGLPSDTEWGNVGKGTPYWYVFMEIVYREPSMQGG